MQLAAARSYRAALQTHVVMALIVGVPGGYSAWVALTTNSKAWELAAFAGGIYVVLLIWTIAFEIKITGQQLVFRSLLGRTQRIAIDDIRSVRFDVSFGHGGGPLRLVVESKSAPGEIAMAINAKVFRPEAIRAVMALSARSDLGGLDKGVVTRSIVKRSSRRLR